MKPTLGKAVVYLFLVVLALSASTILYWLYGPSQVLKVKNGPVPVRPAAQKSDELVFLIVNYCKLQPVKGIVRRTLVSSTVRIMLPLQSDTGPKDCNQADLPLLIPKGVVPDTYRVHIDVDYQINPLRKVTNSLDSQNFVIQ